MKTYMNDISIYMNDSGHLIHVKDKGYPIHGELTIPTIYLLL